METLVIDPKESKFRKSVRIVVSLYFILFCGYFVFTEAAIDSYGALFLAAVVGAFSALMLFLSNTLWTSDKKLLVIDNSAVECNIPSCKFQADWVSVSKVTIEEDCILFFTDGGRRERKIELAKLFFKDIKPIKNKIAELCQHKSIPCTQL